MPGRKQRDITAKEYLVMVNVFCNQKGLTGRIRRDFIEWAMEYYAKGIVPEFKKALDKMKKPT
jgi:hypothetical protein